MQTPSLPSVTLVLLVANNMLPIENLMVDGGCIATTGGISLFCIYIYIYIYIYSPAILQPVVD
jgi:hypothetical protein